MTVEQIVNVEFSAFAGLGGGSAGKDPGPYFKYKSTRRSPL